MSITNRAAGQSFLDPITSTLNNPFNQKVPNTGLRAPDFPDGFEIVEIVEGKEQKPFMLVGSFMPMQPFPWEVEQRIVKNYYPGNPEAVAQLFGAKEGDLTIHGRFKDKRFKDPSYYGASYEFAKYLEGVARRGNLLKFGFVGPGGSWIRWGYLEKPQFKMNKLSWIEYTLNFFVVSVNRPKNNYFAAKEKVAPDHLNSNLLNAGQNFTNTAAKIPTSMPQSLADKINGLTSKVASAVNNVTNFVQNIINQGMALDMAAQRALGLIKNAQANLSSMKRQIDQTAHDFTHLSSQGNNPGMTRDTYENLAFIYSLVSTAVSVGQVLTQMKALFESIAITVPLARHKVQGTETLQKISVQYYGTVDDWDKIYTHNNLTTTVLTPGQILEIPRL